MVFLLAGSPGDDFEAARSQRVAGKVEENAKHVCHYREIAFGD